MGVLHRPAFLLAAALLIFGSLGWAQTAAELGGTVTDTTGAVIPDVSVIVTHLTTQGIS